MNSTLEIAHYIPILKAKLGEFGAIEEVRLSTKVLLTPLFDIPHMGSESDEPAADSLDDYLQAKVAHIRKAWVCEERAFFVDLYDTDTDARARDGTHPVSVVFSILREAPALGIPVTGLDRDGAYQEAVRGVVGGDKRGIAVRLLREDLVSANQLGKQLAELMTFVGVRREEVSLLLVFRKVEESEADYIYSTAARTIAGLPGLSEWRTLTFAAGGMPESLSTRISKGATGEITRTDLALWTRLRNADLKRPPTFADYGVVHPDHQHFSNPRALKLTPSIRYATEDRWLILRGYPIDSHPDGWEQVYALSRDLVGRPQFSGQNFSWGDEQIERRARSRPGTGNATSWIGFGTNHHLTFVSKQVDAALAGSRQPDR